LIWSELIKFLFGTAFISGLIAYLGRKIIDNYFSRGVEKYKTELEKIKFEHEVKFAKLHEERALVIKELFSKLVTAENSFGSFVAIFEPVGQLPKEEKGKIAAEDFNNFVEYYRLNEIYFSDEISELFYKIINEIRDAWYKFVMYPSYKKTEHFLPDPQLAELEKKKIDNWIAAWKTTKEDLPPLKKKLKRELQKLLGIEVDKY